MLVDTVLALRTGCNHVCWPAHRPRQRRKERTSIPHNVWRTRGGCLPGQLAVGCLVRIGPSCRSCFRGEKEKASSSQAAGGRILSSITFARRRECDTVCTSSHVVVLNSKGPRGIGSRSCRADRKKKKARLVFGCTRQRQWYLPLRRTLYPTYLTSKTRHSESSNSARRSALHFSPCLWSISQAHFPGR